MQVGPDPPLHPFAGLAAERAASKHALGDIPLAILVRGLAEDMGPHNAATEADRRRDFASVAGLSSNGRVVVAQKAAVTCIWISPPF